ncbi:MAG: penicillin-insensitive murein endopeptidase [Nitrospirota bacterium]|nr:MAG: penicillin-insensitive murein endopeptidase [Nitrospirota bacterium]
MLIALLLSFAGSPDIAALEDSVCYGTPGNGRIENSVKLQDKGNNFISYGTVPELLGRTYVHNKVRDVVVDAYRILEKELPDKVYKFAETGKKKGGEFKPHKTHQNGLSVDFIVPVIDKTGRSVQLPTNIFNKYGYSVEFDDKGVKGIYRIDFEAMGAHIVALHKAAKNSGIGIQRVLFDPALQRYIYASSYGAYIRRNIKMPEKRSWVRHDDHYHVDFIVKCEP